MSSDQYLRSYLRPIEPWLTDDSVTDILINSPGEIWVETRSNKLSRIEVEELQPQLLLRLAHQIAANSHQAINREHPIISATLPGGVRSQVVIAPAAREGALFAFRRHGLADLSLGQLGKSGLFDSAMEVGSAIDEELRALLHGGLVEEFLRRAVQLRKTIVVSGGTGSGKTTLLNALLKEIDDGERIISIEDTPEVRLRHTNAVGLIAVRGQQGEAQVDTEALLQAALRMRPDRIVLGEIRGTEAFAYLRAVNVGHPGSITTIHADSCKGAASQLAMLASVAQSSISFSDLEAYIRNVIDVFVHVSKDANGRRVREIEFRPTR